MDIRLKLLAAGMGLVFLAGVLRAIRGSSMRPSLGWLWLGIAAFLVSVPVLEPLYKWVSVRLLGIEDARTLVYVALIGFLLLHAFRVTLVMSRALERIQALITHTAILEAQIAALEGERRADPQGRA